MCVGNVNCYKDVHMSSDIKKTRLIETTEELSSDLKIKTDLLTKATFITKVTLCHLNHITNSLQQYYVYKKFTKFTQPAHIITLLTALMLATILNPTDQPTELSPSPIWKLLYLASFAAHFGFQIWMTFVSGLALYLTLPRHTFGQVQKVLFPKYFMFNALLSLITLSTFLKHQSDMWIETIFVQIIALVVCFCVELLIRLYITPILLRLITEKLLIEASVGLGTEVGKHDFGSLVNCPDYMRLHSTFRKTHMLIAVGNIVTMACTAVHLHFLAARINL